jgi:phosphoribosylformylglycinamidine synthase
MNPRDAGLTEGEYARITDRLGREPNELELRLLGVMASEHCSYKSTRRLLRLFPNQGPAVVQGPGENSGVVDLGEGWGLAFKVESHNHPCAVSPVQGAATGVGGIIRDILAVGARPVASLDGLFLGEDDSLRTSRLIDGVVEGIGSYGNAVGVPTVGGKTLYDPAYRDNPLVNAFCAGLLRLDRIVSSRTARPGMLAVLLGARTGRDGIAGASFASRQLDEDSEASRPQIQIGDPFEEKRLIEACLEILERDLIASMQDMGAAGILSSSSEIAHKSGCGIRIDCEAIPLRAEDMEPWEIFLSESQERMLLVVPPENLEAVRALARRHELECVPIGEIEAGGRYRVLKEGRPLADLPVDLLGEAPEAEREEAEADRRERWAFDAEALEPRDPGTDILSLLASPSLADKRGIWERYDSQVGNRTAQGPGAPVSVLWIRENGRMVAMSMEALPHLCDLDPRNGAAEAMARSLRALWVCGAVPLGMTNCLNFPSPEDPRQYRVLADCVRGLAFACRELECPVVSGNVSLYNESPAGPILPTPLVVSVGRIERPEGWVRSGRWRPGDRIVLAGTPAASLAGGAWQRTLLGVCAGRPLPLSPEAERDFRARALEAAKRELPASARPLAGGGLALALAREAIASGVGAQVALEQPTRSEVALFGEGGPRAIYAVSPDRLVPFLQLFRGFPTALIGTAGGDSLRVGGAFGDRSLSFDLPLEALSRAFREGGGRS